VVKLLIGRHKVAKRLVDNGSTLNLIMRRTFIEMGLNLAELTPVHDIFHGVISGQSSTRIGRIDLEVTCGTGDNKSREIFMFEVTSFDIGYNCILGRPFLLKFVTVIHTTYATIKMPSPKGMIVLKFDQWDALACESATLAHAGPFDTKVSEEQAAKMAKTQGSNIQIRSPVLKPPNSSIPRPPSMKKGRNIVSGSNPLPVNQQTDDKKTGAIDKEVLVNASDLDKKLHVSTSLEAK
jgi:hypothetical protein